VKKFLVVLGLFFCFSCTAPDFSVSQCVSTCSQCGIDTCQELCEALDLGMQTEECAVPSENVWVCATTVGCTFGTECVEEITEFLTCEP
jgi:hypothetical protein